MHRTILAAFFLLCLLAASAQQSHDWNGRSCAVVLTYDDGLAVDLDNVIPVLDSLELKATFYINASATSLNERMPEWRAAAATGHELGNHTLYNPCDGSKPGRDWVNPEHDLAEYSIRQITDEIRLANTLLMAVDGKSRRTFAYTCGDIATSEGNFIASIREHVVAARGVSYSRLHPKEIDLMQIPAFSVEGHSGDALIDVVKEAEKMHTLVVFLFHGVGGGHSLNVAKQDHLELLSYLKAHTEDIWVGTMLDVADWIAEEQKK